MASVNKNTIVEVEITLELIRLKEVELQIQRRPVDRSRQQGESHGCPNQIKHDKFMNIKDI